PRFGGTQYVCDDSAGVAVPRRIAGRGEPGRIDQILDVALGRSDVEKWRTEREDVIDFAGMDDADKRIAHHHRMQVSGRERLAQCLQRLVGQTYDIAQPVARREALDLAEFAASP